MLKIKNLHRGYPCTGGDVREKGYTFSGIGQVRPIMGGISKYRWRCTAEGGYIICDRGKVRACMVDIHEQAEMYGRRGIHYLG